MIKKILNGKTCAECRLCCGFDRYDIWETPLFEEETMKAVKEKVPSAEFAKRGNGYVLNAGMLTDGDLFLCPALTETGCMLGTAKPFDCSIWPFRIMSLDGVRVIAVSSLCNAVYDLPHDSLREFLLEGLAAEIFSYADRYPEAVHTFCDNYAVLIKENEM